MPANNEQTAAHPMATTNARIPLPREIWGLICAKADDFTLWVVYRQVSNLVRSEAEREFVQTRLPKLRIKFPCSGKIPGIQYTCEHKDEDDRDVHRVVGLSEDGQLARVQLNVHIFIEANDIARRSCKTKDVKTSQMAVNVAFTRTLEDIDIDFARGSDAEVSATLGFFTNNNPLRAPKMDVHNNECFIDFKRFLCEFYGDYAYVGRLLDPQRPYQAVLELIATSESTELLKITDHEENILTDLSYVRKDMRLWIGSSKVERLFQRAYIARVKWAYARRGMQLTPRVKEVVELHSNAGRLAEAWVRQICECVKKENTRQSKTLAGAAGTAR